MWSFLIILACGESKETDTADSAAVEEVDADGDGFSEEEDCDDFNPSVYPGASDAVGDDKDQNCDGLDGVDSDGDGYASEGSGGTDCDDSSAQINPSQLDECGDSLDNDCDGVVDEGQAWYLDSDGDGYGDPASIQESCDALEGYVSVGQDCDDGNTDPLLRGDLCLPHGISLMHVTTGVEFLAGSSDEEIGHESNESQHQTTLTRNFFIMNTEVTQAQFDAVMGYNPASFSAAGNYNDCGLDCPVESMTWHEAAAFGNALSDAEGLENCYSCDESSGALVCESNGDPYTCAGYRLPTEHEWEFAARAGTDKSFWTESGGSDIVAGTEYDCDPSVSLNDGTRLVDIGWFCSNNGQPNQDNYGPKPVGQLLANGFGLYDMHGNVWEVAHDWYDDYESSYVPVDPVGPSSGSVKVARGGFWNINPAFIRVAMRGDVYPDDRYDAGGFRIVKTAE